MFLTFAAAVTAGWLGLRLQDRVWHRATISEEGNILGAAALNSRWPAARPEDIPRLPGSRLLMPAKQKLSPEGWWYQGVYATERSVAEVRSFYQKSLMRVGWRIDTQLAKGLREQGNILLFRRGINRLKIVILPNRKRRGGCGFWLSLEVITRAPVRRR